MSAKAYIISLSLIGATAGLGCWLLMGETAPASAAPVAKSSTKTRLSAPLAQVPATTALSAAKTKSKPLPPDEGSRLAGSAAAVPLVPEQIAPEARAARVEQEANHELRRLVTLLNLNETQQDQVFHTLARNSRYWSPEMQIAAPGSTSTGGKHTGSLEPGPLLLLPGPAIETVPDKTPPPDKSSSPADTATLPPAPDTITAIGTVPDGATDKPPMTDAMSEIMDLLTPEQQAALIESETDRAAWWAEILPQILPEEPKIEETYEGSDKLE